MKSFTTERFRKLYRALPDELRQQTREAYRKFIEDPQHPSSPPQKLMRFF